MFGSVSHFRNVSSSGVAFATRLAIRALVLHRFHRTGALPKTGVTFQGRQALAYFPRPPNGRSAPQNSRCLGLPLNRNGVQLDFIGGTCGWGGMPGMGPGASNGIGAGIPSSPQRAGTFMDVFFQWQPGPTCVGQQVCSPADMNRCLARSPFLWRPP